MKHDVDVWSCRNLELKVLGILAKALQTTLKLNVRPLWWQLYWQRLKDGNQSSLKQIQWLW
ncbi:hypothetical protein FRX31_024002 [Thalictrum thalictroides]|uniref:Uncharacterized protein n=1 Tax=Thalictrum thalictroides TaxID=46969 RepID=A0A7J6VQF1_THATH|nr:hypothetical protein FRX31_024002 [Thalictrum thalictroides]